MHKFSVKLVCKHVSEWSFIMIEQRKHKRYPISLELNVSSLFKQDNVQINNVDAPIEVTDVSKSGIGFKSAGRFPLHYYFNAKLNFGGEDMVIYTVVEIIRSNQDPADPDITRYGCKFVGLSSVFDYIFDDYAKSFENNN